MPGRSGSQVSNKRCNQNLNKSYGQNKKRSTLRDVPKNIDEEKENNDPPVKQSKTRMVCISLCVA